MNLFKGTGLNGLHGIPEKNGNIVRPLLFATKEQVLNYAAEENIFFREDASNKKDKYLRNAVRIHFLPAVEKIFPNAVQQVNESIQRFSQAQILYQKEVSRQIKKLIEKRGNDIYIPVLKLKKLEAAETICYELFNDYNFSPAQIEQILQLVDADSGRFIESTSHRIIKDRNFLILTAKKTTEADFLSVESLPCTVETAHGQFKFSIESAPSKIPPDPKMAFINVQKIHMPLVLRKWRTGDYFYPLGMGMKKKKLSRFLLIRKFLCMRKRTFGYWNRKRK